MAKPVHLALWVDALPGSEIIQLGAFLFDRFFVEEIGGFASYVHPEYPSHTPEALLNLVGIKDHNELTQRMEYWSTFPRVWSYFERWLMSQTASSTFEEASAKVVWTGVDMAQVMHHLTFAANQHNMSLFGKTTPETLSLLSAIKTYENALAYAGYDHSVGSTLEEVCREWKIRTPLLADAMRWSVVVGQAFHVLLKIEKRAYEAVLPKKGKPK